MSALDIVLIVIMSLFVAYLIIVAATEPRYTWQPETLDEWLELLQQRVDAMNERIGARIMSILKETISSIERITQ